MRNRKEIFTSAILIICEGFPIYSRVFSSIHAIPPLDVSNTSPIVVTIKDIYKYCRVSLGLKIIMEGNHITR